MTQETREQRRRVERIIGRTLQGGVILAALLGILGGALFLLRHGQETPDYRVFQSEPAALRSPRGIVQAAAEGDPRAFIMLGLLVLIATPIVRVLLSVVIFAVERDRVYVVITLTVLAILAWSLFGRSAVT